MNIKSAVVILSCVLFSINMKAQDVQSVKMNERHDLVRELNMNSEQEKVYLQLKEKKRNSTKELQQKIVSIRNEMNIALKDENCSKDQIFIYIDKISNMKAQIQKERIEFMFGMKEILSPEQFGKMKKIREEQGIKEYKGKRNPGYSKSAPKKFKNKTTE